MASREKSAEAATSATEVALRLVEDDTLPLSEKFGRLDASAMLSQAPEEVPWVVAPILARGMLTLFAGREGEGKSMFAAALACSVASGEPLAGYVPASKGKVLYLDAENGVQETHRRLRALGFAGALGTTDPQAPKRIAVYEARGFDLATDSAELERLLMVERPTLLVVDSLQSVYFGSEYSIRVAKVLDNLRRLLQTYDCAGLLIHHSVKSRKLQIVRGGTKLLSRPEMTYFFGRAADDSEPGRRMIVCQKQRCGAEPEPKWVKIGTEGDLLVIDQTAPFVGPDDPPPSRPVRDVLLSSVYWTVAGAARPLNRSEVAAQLHRDPKDRSVGRCLDELVSTGQLTRRGNLYSTP